MPSKDYYVILGISPGESQGGIKSAFRDLARKYHPDRAGARSTRQFQEVSEAYNVLGDPQRRAAYDRGRRAGEETPGRRHNVRRSAQTVEPLDPGPVETFQARRRPDPVERVSMLEDFVASHPTRDDVVDRFRRNFSDEWMPKSGRVDALNLVLDISPEDAWWGATVELGVPVFYPCPYCHGTGHSRFLYPCPRCHESGTLTREERVRLRIPAGVRDGSLFEIPLRGLGIQNFSLRVLVRVAE